MATAAKVSVPESCVIITALSANAVAPVPPFDTGNVLDKVAAVVAVAAFPVHEPELPEAFPVTFPVNAPTNAVAVSVPVEGL